MPGGEELGVQRTCRASAALGRAAAWTGGCGSRPAAPAAHPPTRPARTQPKAANSPTPPAQSPTHGLKGWTSYVPVNLGEVPDLLLICPQRGQPDGVGQVAEGWVGKHGHVACHACHECGGHTGRGMGGGSAQRRGERAFHSGRGPSPRQVSTVSSCGMAGPPRLDHAPAPAALQGSLSPGPAKPSHARALPACQAPPPPAPTHPAVRGTHPAPACTAVCWGGACTAPEEGAK